VTLSDEEARRRGTQKTVLERRAPPTFDVLIEIQTRDRLIVHEDVALAVDGLLRSRPMPAELRLRNSEGEIEIETVIPDMNSMGEPRDGRSSRERERGGMDRSGPRRVTRTDRGEDRYERPEFAPREFLTPNGGSSPDGMRVYAYGVARNRLQQAARRLRAPLVIVDDFGQADAIVTLKNYYRRRPKLIVDAERRGTPIYVLRANTVSQMENFLMDVFHTEEDDRSNDPFGEAMRETKEAIMQVRAGAQYVDLSPQAAHVRRKQHEEARRARLESTSYGQEPQRHVRILNRQAS
jgi:hypothetical protein